MENENITIIAKSRVKLEDLPFTINARVEKQNSVLKDLSHNPRPYPDYKWCSPPPGSLKINCNAAVGEKKGLYSSGWLKIIEKCKPETAEAKAAQFPLLMAHEENLDSTVGEGDNKC